MNCQNDSSGSSSPGNAKIIKIITDQTKAGILYLINKKLIQISDYQLTLYIYLLLKDR